MKLFAVATVCFFISFATLAQNGDPMVVNKLPDYILPAPEASSLIKADNLTVGYSTGSPNINIPLASLSLNDFSWPVSLSYSSTGVKIDEYSSMVGMGWNINFAGVVSRTVLDHPDELRDPNNCNLNTYNFNNPGTAEHNFLRNALDKESDIFTFSFGGYNGKFIIGLNNQAAQITKNNIKIEFVNNNFQNGFIIRTDDGTAYHFEDAEISTSRNPSGTDCEKTNDNSSVKTSWYLTKIVLPSTNKQINFTYTSVANVAFQSSISQTISKVTSSENNPCNFSPACAVGSERFSTCISRQLVTSKYISEIITTDGDKISFFYDAVSRADLDNGKRLSSLKLINRNGVLLREVTFNSTYITANTGGGLTTYDHKRLFLQDIQIEGGEGIITPLQYSFEYDNYASLPARLSYSQDFYGYYNGKINNASLIPKLASTDVNYSTYSNGNGGTSVQFGDRSIDPDFSTKGLLTKITFPTGGYEEIEYTSNKAIKIVGGVETEVLAGGNSVSKIKSYTFDSNLELEKEFVYRNMSDNKLSSFLLTKNLIFSQLTTTKKDGLGCGGIPYTEGPACTYAVVTSNSNVPVTTYGSQHIYHTSVIEKIKKGTNDNGIIEHIYDYFAFGVLHPRHWLGNTILNTQYQITPDILMGERFTNIYKPNGTSYSMVKSKENVMTIDGLTEYHNYTVKKNFERLTMEDPPILATFNPYDVEDTYINVYTIRTGQVIEKEYGNNGVVLTKTTDMTYSPLYTYPKTITTIGSDNVQTLIERKYPPDDPALSYMTDRNIISPVIEEKFKRNSLLQYTKTQTYLNWFGNSTIIEPQFIDLKIEGIDPQTQRVIFYSYDNSGNVKELSKELDQHFSYIWGYGGNYPCAKVHNAPLDKIAYTSFETDEAGGWSGITTSGSATIGSITGQKAWDQGNFNFNKSGLSATSAYIVSYWKKSGTVNVNGTTAVSGRSVNDWTYYEHKVENPAGGQITVSGTNGVIIDELRLYPAKAQMTTFTYDPLIGMTSQCDANNRIVYYEYDEFQRLKLVRDQDNNIIKKLDYKYQANNQQ